MGQIGPTNRVWVGVTDREKEGLYRWADGRVVTTEQMGLYSPGGPNDGGSGEDCTMIRSTNTGEKLNDTPCDGLINYICEIAIE